MADEQAGFVNGVLRDSNGDPSSKRVFAAIAFAAMFLCLGIAIVWPARSPPQYIFDGFLFLTGGLLLGTIPEWFVKGRT